LFNPFVSKNPQIRLLDFMSLTEFYGRRPHKVHPEKHFFQIRPWNRGSATAGISRKRKKEGGSVEIGTSNGPGPDSRKKTEVAFYRSEPAETSSVVGSAAARAAFGSGTGFIDDEFPAVEFRSVQPVLGFPGRIRCRHFDKPEAAALEDVDRGNLAVLGKQLFQLVFGRPVVQVANIKLV
jgi:hypothetical protein